MLAETKKFKKYLQSSDLKETTIKNYLWHLEKFFTWLEDKKLSENNLREYFKILLKKYPQVSSINLRLIILNNYLKFQNKRFRFALLSNKPNDLKIISQSQLQAFLAAPLKNKNLIGLRDKALLELLYSSGLKVGQIIKIKLSQIDYIKKQIIFDSKNILDIEPTAWFYLQKYLSKRKKLFIDTSDNPWLFINFDRAQKNPNRQLSIRSVERLLNKYAKLSNSFIILNPQILRNTLAYKLKQDGANYHELKKTLHFKTKLGAKEYLKRI